MSSQARFCLLLAERATGCDVMAECALCGAMTEASLFAAWEERAVRCSTCEVEMTFDQHVLTRLRDQAVMALATIDQLR